MGRHHGITVLTLTQSASLVSYTYSFLMMTINRIFETNKKLNILIKIKKILLSYRRQNSPKSNCELKISPWILQTIKYL